MVWLGAVGARCRGVRVYSTAARLVGAEPTIRGPMRPFTGTVLGFLFGFGAASLCGLFMLQREFNLAVSSVANSSDMLAGAAANRVEMLENEVRRMRKNAVTLTDASRASESNDKLYRDMFEETLSLRERMWNLEHAIFATRAVAPDPDWAPPLVHTKTLPAVRLI
ncbi:hypothetical protein MVES_001732 [Malassezia vespertilionis]|uniref:Uncharacterized protein n=1 Tax=Malassezia vespertilionis TaxID=2020962 RepID=A0A2N1JCG3_9BASI|nr:hypothetical protein MVES_001732 [Malassezia vespertilionis]